MPLSTLQWNLQERTASKIVGEKHSTVFSLFFQGTVYQIKHGGSDRTGRVTEEAGACMAQGN